MSDPAPKHAAPLLLDLEARQDDVLRQLDELNRRVEAVLAQCRPQVGPPESDSRTA
jgi:hypothetical protein